MADMKENSVPPFCCTTAQIAMIHVLVTGIVSSGTSDKDWSCLAKMEGKLQK